MKKNLLLICLCWCQTGFASSLDLNLNSDAFRITYATFTAKRTIADFSGLFLDRNNNRDDGVGFHAGLYYSLPPLRLGARVFYLSPGASDLLALGLGGQGETYLSRRVIIGGHVYYGPRALSFMDGEGYSEFALRLAYKVSKAARIYLGYRNLKFRILTYNNKVEVDDGFHIGAKFYF